MTKQEIMQRQPREHVYRNLLFGMACGDAILYMVFRGDIPHRDYVACRIGLGSIIVLTLFESREGRKRLDSKRFRSIFSALSTMEILFTILIPWLIILEGIFNKPLTSKNGHLLAAHLFIFQAQIAGECVIELAGDHRTWLVFPFTCVANIYRGVTIATWIQRLLEQPSIDGRDIIMPLTTAVLWIYSTFIFIPQIWYPLIKNNCNKPTESPQ